MEQIVPVIEDQDGVDRRPDMVRQQSADGQEMSFGALFRRAAPDVEARQAATWPSVHPGAKHFADIVRDRTQLGHWEVRSSSCHFGRL